MNAHVKRIVTTLSAFLAVSGSAHAQEISTSLPLTSVGDKLMWTVGDQELNLDVPLSGRVRLELYSPRLDQSDYRGDHYYGDEQYNANQSPVNTTFTLLGEDGTPILTRTFTPGPHAWETLIDQDLPAGRYHLKAVTAGNGKNTFAVRLAGVSAVVTADVLSVNVHARDWVPAVNITTDGQPHVLRVYDGDGPQELEARLRDEQGRVYPLTVSEDLATVDLPLPEQAGRYVLELRQPATARQFSNTVGFRLTRAGTPTPITIAKVDQTGLLRVTAELVLPGGNVPTTAGVVIGTTPVTVASRFEQQVKADTYTLNASPVTGADVSVTPSVTVPKDGVAEARVQVRPQVSLTVTTDKPDVCVGDTVTLSARAETAFAGDLPLDLTLNVPGLALQGLNHLQSTLSADRPGELRVTGTATRAGLLDVSAKLDPWGQEQRLTVNVRPSVTSLQVQRLPLPAATVGDEVQVTLTVKNISGQDVPFSLTDTPGEGLDALGNTHFEGRLEGGETRTLTYRARVLSAGTLNLQGELRTPSCPTPQTVGGQLAAQPVPAPRPAPEAKRVSTVTLPFEAPRQAQELVVAHALPEGATFTPGSARLNGQPLPDPTRGPSGTLYWVIPTTPAKGAGVSGVISYDLAHTGPLTELPRPALLVRYGADRSEQLEGQVDLKDLKAATPLNLPEQATENSGAIKLPLAGSDIRIRDRISVVVEVPQGTRPPLLINGQPVPEDRIGQTVEDGPRGVSRLTYVGVPLVVGPNDLQVGADHVTINRVGPTTRVEVTPQALIADGSTPLRLKLRSLDAYGRRSDPGTVTVRSNLEVRSADASPGEAGYQVQVLNGEGILELQPQSSPTTLRLEVLEGQQVKVYTFEVKPDANRVGVGMLSATVGIDGNFSVQDDLTWQGRASYEGPLAGGKLYVAADKDGLPTDRDTLRRFSVYGDSSVESVPLQGIDPVALAYDHPNFRAQYRRTALPVDVLPVGEQFTALSAYSKTNPQVSGFVALVPTERITGERLTPENTRLLRLAHGNISAGSETLELVTLENGTGKELRRVTLVRNVDYQLDLSTGIITLSGPLDHVDANLNTLVVLASYRLDNPMSDRQLAYGVQVKQTGEHYAVGVAAVSLDQRVTYGVRATYDDGTLRADGLLAYSGGVQASADFGARLGDDTIRARVRYQDASYQGLAPFTPGLNASAAYDAQLGRNLSANLEGEYHSTYGSTASQGGSVTARAAYRVAPFTVGGGLKYAFGDSYGLGAVISAGYHRRPLDVDVVHTQPLLGGLGGNLDPVTVVTTRYAITDRVTVGLSDQINWKTGQTAVLTLDSVLGNTNYQLAYDLPNSGGQGNRARFGVSTTLPLNDHLTAGLRGNALYNVTTQGTELGAGTDLNYKTDTLSAAIGTDVVYRNDPTTPATNGFGVVVRAGATGSLNEHLSVTADGLVEFGAGKNGQRAALGYAYRNRTFNSLGTVRYVNGTLADNKPELSSNLAAEYRQTNWAVRGALDTRTLLNDTSSFTMQGGLSGTYYVTDSIGVGAWGHAISQPATSSLQYGFGLEASVRALPGTWITAGYNPVGFTGIGSAYTRQGAYLRLDLTLDETLNTDQNK